MKKKDLINLLEEKTGKSPLVCQIFIDTLLSIGQEQLLQGGRFVIGKIGYLTLNTDEKEPTFNFHTYEGFKEKLNPEIPSTEE